MRIRSIKPEFWRSPDVAELSIEDRLLWIGLWSYVDDNGVGKDRAPVIAADLFAFDLSRDAPDTLARVSRGLQHLSASGRITRYTIDGDDWLCINNWSRHQRIDRPNKPRYPLPTSDNAEIRESVASVSRESRETPSTGTGEQGNRGSGEQGNSQSRKRSETTPDGFDAWWSQWPKKVAKAAALKAYKTALKKTDALTLGQKAHAFIEAEKRKGTAIEYIPNPASWLNQERWEDDTSTPAAMAPKPEWMKYV